MWNADRMTTTVGNKTILDYVRLRVSPDHERYVDACKAFGPGKPNGATVEWRLERAEWDAFLLEAASDILEG